MSHEEQKTQAEAEIPAAELPENDLQDVAGGTNILLMPAIIVAIPVPEGNSETQK